MAKESIVIIPVKEYSERIPRKNFLLINGTPLYQIFPITLKQSGKFSDVVIDTDSATIQSWCHDNGIKVLNRVPELAYNTANGNSLLRYHVKCFPGYQFYWQAFVTSPFISVKTVQLLADMLYRRGTYDSVMTAKLLRGHFWDFHGKPFYRTELMPRSQDVTPIYQEVCGLFGITAEAFEVSQTRFGHRPYLHALPAEECADIDWPSDIPGQANVAPVAAGYRQD